MISWCTMSHPWIENPLENRVIFVKIRETDRERFHRFLKNRPVKFEIFKNL
jgi:hypothetical protein